MMIKLLRFLIGITIAASPLYVVRWTYFDVLPTTLLEVLIWFVISVWILWKVSQKSLTTHWASVTKIAALFIIAGVIATLVSADTVAALGILKSYILEPVFVFFILYDVYSASNEEDKKTLYSYIWTGLLIAAFWLSVLGIFQGLWGKWIITAHQADRAHAVFNNGNALALYLGPIVSLLIAKIAWKDGYVLKLNNTLILFEYLTLVLAVMASILTFSTGGLLALTMVTILVIVSDVIDFRLLLKLTVFGTFLGSIVLLPVSERYASNQLNPWDRQGGTEEIRLCVWEGTYNLLKDNWVLGSGLSGFKEMYSSNYVTCDAEPLEYPHNLYMTIWTELGLLGLGSVLVLFQKLISLTKQKSVYWVGLIYILIHGIVDVPYFKNDLSLIFWILVFLVIINKDVFSIEDK